MTLILIDFKTGDYKEENSEEARKPDYAQGMLVELVRAYASNDGQTRIQFLQNDRSWSLKAGESIGAKLQTAAIDLPFAVFIDALRTAHEHGLAVPDFSLNGVFELRRLYNIKDGATPEVKKQTWEGVNRVKPLRFRG